MSRNTCIPNALTRQALRLLNLTFLYNNALNATQKVVGTSNRGSKKRTTSPVLIIPSKTKPVIMVIK